MKYGFPIVGAVAALSLAASIVLLPTLSAYGHGNVTPQPVDTTGLPSLGKDWKTADPYVGNAKAIEIGASGYKLNCARCHGAELNSGGMAPDLHPFPTGQEGDDIYIGLVRDGKKQNGEEKMPAFSPIVSQEGLWAIRAYIEANHKE